MNELNKLPRAKKSEFMYKMKLLFDAMDKRKLGLIPVDLIKKLDADEQSSLIYYLLYIYKPIIRGKNG